MECSQFMKILKELLISWSPEISLGEMTECNCLNCKTPVINFDKIKDFCCTKEKYALPSLSSVDCLYFDEHRSTLYLLECKDFQQYKKFNQDREFCKKLRHNTGLTKQQLIEAFTRDFFANMEINLTNKLIDSYALLLAIVGEHAEKFSNDLSRFSCLLNRKILKIKYFIITNLNEQDYEIARISNLENYNEFMSYRKFRFLSKTAIIAANEFDELIQIANSINQYTEL